jgi:cytochrome c oxidase assembly protein subunit 15
MVKSGLEMDPAQKNQIRVSPYRLATHLTMAFATYSLLVWTALELNKPVNRFNGSASVRQIISESSFSLAQRLAAIKVRRTATLATALVACTAFTGAFVAGTC